MYELHCLTFLPHRQMRGGRKGGREEEGEEKEKQMHGGVQRMERSRSPSL